MFFFFVLFLLYIHRPKLFGMVSKTNAKSFIAAPFEQSITVGWKKIVPCSQIVFGALNYN